MDLRPVGQSPRAPTVLQHHDSAHAQGDVSMVPLDALQAISRNDPDEDGEQEERT